MMTELTEKGYVCIVIASYPLGTTEVVGVYDSEDLAVRRVKELGDLGLIKDGAFVSYINDVIWREKA